MGEAFLKKDHGFTLIELVIVVVIIGILTGVLVPAVVGRVKDAKVSRYKADLDSIAAAARMFYIENDAWPDNIGLLKSYGITPGAKDPWDSPYTVTPTGPHGELVIDGGDNESAVPLKIPAPIQEND